MTTRIRPERSGPPELFYNEDEACRYASNSHIISIQTEMAQRALELLALPDGKIGYILDIGCGSGVSGNVLTCANHFWVGLDISMPMLKIASSDEENDGRCDLVWKDMGTGIPFRPGSFDGAISISAIQWLCHANSSDENPKKRLHRFFETLYASLGRGARAVFQFYPENELQTELIMSQAVKAGFNGGLVIDFPNSAKAKKVYLVLMTGGVVPLPKALTAEDYVGNQTQVDNIQRRVFVTGKQREKKPVKGSKAWIEKKRERMIKQGRDVRPESKFSGRRRRTKF